MPDEEDGLEPLRRAGSDPQNPAAATHGIRVISQEPARIGDPPH